MFPGVLDSSLIGKARKKGLVSYDLVQIRDFAQDKHKTVDDTPYGGGEGMVLRADVLFHAWKSVVSTILAQSCTHSPDALLLDRNHLKKQGVTTVLLSPQGKVFNQSLAKELAGYSHLILICGHYEGVDERFIDLCVDREISIGDYVLTGGELPALVLADTVTRLVPGVVGNERSLTEESLETGLLKYPQYTRPREFQGLSVPEILMKGDHGAIRRWREEAMEERTREKRPDLWKAYLENRKNPKKG